MCSAHIHKQVFGLGTRLLDQTFDVNVHRSSSLEQEPGLKGYVSDRKGTPKNLCDKDFAELSRELSGVIILASNLESAGSIHHVM